MAEVHEPSDSEKARVFMAFTDAVQRFEGLFKIGCCPVAEFDSIASRQDLAGARKIKNLFIGSKRRAAWVADWLTTKAKERYPQRCANQADAGSQPLVADANVVFVALW
jgi:hypothetical protein